MDIDEKFGLNANYLRWLHWTPRNKIGLIGKLSSNAEKILTRQVERVVDLNAGEEGDEVSCFIVNHGDGDMDSLQSKLGVIDFNRAALLLTCGNGDGAWQKNAFDSESNKVNLTSLKDFFIKEKLHYRIYYIYPNLHFCKYLFSDEYLPQPEMISIRQWKGRNENEVETDLLKSALKSGRFPEAVRGFLCLAWREYFPWQVDLPRLVKFSNMRRKTTAIYTSLTDSEALKTAAWPEGYLHINRYVEHADRLREQYRVAGIDVPDCRCEGYSAISSIVEGRSLRDILDECYYNKDEDFFNYIDDYINRVRLANSNGYFDFSNEFLTMFGKRGLPVGLRSGTYNNIDLIFDNILVSNNGVWSMIDHEWTLEFPLPYQYILWRAIYYYFNLKPETEQQKSWKERCWEVAGITKGLMETYRKMEVNFQASLL